MSSDVAQLFVRVPESLKYLVDQDERTNQELVISALETELGVSADDSVAVVERRIRRLEDRLEDEKAELEERQKRLRNVRDELERARNIKEEKTEREGEYRDRLDTIIDRMVDDSDDLRHVPEEHGVIDELRAEYDRSNSEIHMDLKDRAIERDVDLSVGEFKQRRFADRDDMLTPIGEDSTEVAQ